MNQEIYNTLKPQSPSRLITPNSHAAAYTWEEWLKANNSRELKDADGHPWQLILQQEKLPDPTISQGVWKVNLRLVTKVTARDLLISHILDTVKDARLISMLSDNHLDFSMKPSVHVSSRIEDARVWLRDQMTIARKRLLNPDIRQIKRSLAIRWLSESRIFGAHK